jgi:hypothetical protein
MAAMLPNGLSVADAAQSADGKTGLSDIGTSVTNGAVFRSGNSNGRQTPQPAENSDLKKQDSPATPTVRTTPKTESASGGADQGDASASASGGNGASQRRTVAAHNDWHLHESIAGQSTDPDRENKAEADANAGLQRIGAVQPVLQDRAQAPNRELGLSGATSGQSNGRGGPSPQKKSRGVGALLLGVPMPDFISAKLLAGTSRLTRFLVPPQKTSIAPAPAAPVASIGSVDEPAVPHCDIPVESRGDVDRYFDALHQETADSTDAPDPAPSETSSAKE